MMSAQLTIICKLPVRGDEPETMSFTAVLMPQLPVGALVSRIFFRSFLWRRYIDCARTHFRVWRCFVY